MIYSGKSSKYLIIFVTDSDLTWDSPVMRQSKQIRRKSDKKSELLQDNIPGKTKALMINNTVAPNPDYTEHHVEAGKRIYHIAILKRERKQCIKRGFES